MMHCFPGIEAGLARSRAIQMLESPQTDGPSVNGDYQAPT